MIRLFFKTIWNNRRRNILVFIELFMISLVMVNLTIYLVNMWAIFRIKNCYHTDNVVVVNIGIRTPEDKIITEHSFQNLKKVFASNSFVESVSISNNALPYNYNINTSDFRHDSDHFYFALRQVDIDYAKVMNIKPLSGRWFDETDLGKAVEPVVISNEINDKYFKGGAVGERIQEIRRDKAIKEYEIVGVVDRFKRSDIESPNPCAFFLKDSVRAQAYWETSVLVRTRENRTGDMLAVAESQVYSTLNPENWTIDSLNSLENMHDSQNADSYQRNYMTVIIALFIMINVLLGTIGILWYNTNLRIHEIGIRRAIGSTGSGIKRLLVMENVVIAGLGLLIVILVVLQTPTFFGDGRTEPGVITLSVWISTILMIILVLFSTWVPAQIASKIRPAHALKTE